jgi:hypothetical protein
MVGVNAFLNYINNSSIILIVKIVKCEIKQKLGARKEEKHPFFNKVMREDF